MPLTDVLGIDGEEGDFTVRLQRNPRYIDPDKCIACGECAAKCPKKVDNEFNVGLDKRRSAHIMYDQTVPLKYAIEEESCIYLQKGKCRACEKVCPADAVDFEQKAVEETIRVGSVILSSGYKAFNPSAYKNYAYAEIPDVITGMEYERLLSASGPCQGHVIRPSDSTEPKKIAWIQCIGSRSINKCDNPYCSNVCCMYAIKQSLVTAEHAHGPDHTQTIFFMDIRAHNKGFEQFYHQAENRGVRMLRARPHSFFPGPDDKGVIAQWVDEAGNAFTEEFDLAILSVGLEAPDSAAELAKAAGIECDRFGFADTQTFDRIYTSRKGIYACGAFEAPKDIPRSVMQAGAAACGATSTLALARGTESKTKTLPPPRDVSGEPPRIGVFLCHCGVNISSVIDLEVLQEYIQALPDVVHVEQNLFSCSQDTHVHLSKVIEEQNLNRVVVAACTPRTHEPLFRETLENAGLNKYLFSMANIRNHGSWVHANDPAAATEKAKDQVRMAVSSVRLQHPLTDVSLGITPAALVIGGGVAGMNAALEIAQQGYEAHLIEKTDTLGGHARNLHLSRGGDVQPYLADLEKRLHAQDGVHIHMNSALQDIDGFVGNFKTTIKKNDAEQEIQHGVIIVATGAKQLTPTGLYGYGDSEKIMTQLEMDKKFLSGDLSPKDINTAVFIQCVGSREPDRPYCSRVCCTHSVEAALHIKQQNPDANVYVLYRDMRSYGQREMFYYQAREAGVIFSRFSLNKRPQVSVEGDDVFVMFHDHILQRDLKVKTDMLSLAAAIVPEGANDVAQMIKTPLTDEGWFAEAHAKLRPVESVTDGVYMAGLAHFPKPLGEAVTQARSAVSSACVLLSQKETTLSGAVANINPGKCVSCGVCWTVCPYGAISPNENNIAVVNEALCKGCGLCCSGCRSGAPDLKGFTNADIMAQVTAMLA